MDIYVYIKKIKCIPRANYKKMEQYFFDRIVFLMYSRLFDYNYVIEDWRNIILNLDNLSKHFKPLLGHIIHRELRNFGRYPSFYFYFDQLKALEIWNYWNHTNIAIPFNGIIPKGEIGINPALPDLNFEVYNTEVNQVSKDTIYLNPKKKLDLLYLPRLVDLKFITLRNKNYENQEKRLNASIEF